MKNNFLLILPSFLILLYSNGVTGSTNWKGQWITAFENQNATNTWIAYHKTFDVDKIPGKAIAKVAVDSKYWMWVNGELVVFEGQLKRGPTPHDTYYDEVDIAPFLVKGDNKLAILAWFFGKDGFSHNSSGKAAMIFDCQAPGLELHTDDSWKAIIHPSFGCTGRPHPNFRLPESNIRFDAREGNFEFAGKNFTPEGWRAAKVLGHPPISPWNKLVKRPIPLWKDYGFKNYIKIPRLPFVSKGDTIVCKLPYNAQVTPYFKIESAAGKEIEIRTDHYYGGGPPNVRAEYVTSEGIQEYESLGWMNGHHVRYYFPKGIKVLELKYRETGYNTGFTGSFHCNDPFFNNLWEKAARTLYVTMRDTYMDCPDRERSQWWGDMVIESGEAFYALSPPSRHLTRKGILELINWQRKDSTIFAPIPAGNWDKELPGQMLASVGYFGFWNYYWNSGDIETIKQVYEGVKRYINVWKPDSRGGVQQRSGGWYWGDWGINVDKALLINEWYYLALDGFKRMAELLGKTTEANKINMQMKDYKKSFNAAFWKGDQYRSDKYKGEIDDRAQALAVVAGLADESKYEKIYNLLQSQMYASPYMEKYVIEALFLMKKTEFGLDRLKLRFADMVNYPGITTLWEGWGIGGNGYGGGSTNHAWSGGGLTILSQYVAGIYPIEAGYKTFMVKPQLSYLNEVRARIPSIRGNIDVEIKKSQKTFSIKVRVPKSTKAVVYIPKEYGHISVNNKKIKKARLSAKNKYPVYREATPDTGIEISEGEYIFRSRK